MFCIYKKILSIDMYIMYIVVFFFQDICLEITFVLKEYNLIKLGPRGSDRKVSEEVACACAYACEQRMCAASMFSRQLTRPDGARILICHLFVISTNHFPGSYLASGSRSELTDCILQLALQYAQLCKHYKNVKGFHEHQDMITMQNHNKQL